MTPLNPALAATFPPPVMEARRWLEGISFPPARPLINVSQAAPVDPPPRALREVLADAALNRPEAHLYGPVLGNADLRRALAESWQRFYDAEVDATGVAITQGCNQAFCAAIATLAGAGDEVIIPVPWYFNHKMWLDMQGITAVPLPCGADMVPRAADAAARITSRSRAIVLVSPNNPTGAEYPAATLAEFHDLARQHGLALILDETYRDFDSRSGPPHRLLAGGVDDTLIQLYSFSKAFRLTGHRVGAVIASPARLAEMEKFLDTVAISTGQIGQIGAEWGLRNLGGWLADERRAILDRRAGMLRAAAQMPGWRVVSSGAYFAWLEHPFEMPSDDLARELVRQAAVLMLPGTMFMPQGQGQRHLRVAFANVDGPALMRMAERIADFSGQSLP
ncbi:Aspartate/methionine/tyrosine aminotransferase [Paracoccus isoporae]|uniref:aspartate transaminase n=1 Tax=Paracoccus isoporae TaxID=591205 RepID=A0A1G6XRI8_9RHOB|nr:aminotransferase [Paracoccus isoporae]SDD80814.1 Aspartate/methionine/tyrosine aminotransferase [Paracoccus isoporae]